MYLPCLTTASPGGFGSSACYANYANKQSESETGGNSLKRKLRSDLPPPPSSEGRALLGPIQCKKSGARGGGGFVFDTVCMLIKCNFEKTIYF